MKKLSLKVTLLAVIVLAALNLTGCVVFHSQTDINDDGSGTAELTLSIDPSVQEAIAELQAMDTDQNEDMDFPLLDDVDQDKIKKAGAEYGVSIKKFEKGLVDGRQTLNIVLEYKDLRGFSYVMGRIMGDGNSGEGMGIYDAGDGNFVLKQAQYDFPVDPADEEVVEEITPEDMQSLDPQQMQKQMEIMGKLMGAMAELDVSFKITVPGHIVSSNAPETDGRTSIWTINADNMMTMDQEMDPEIVFSAKGLKITPLTK